MNAKEWVGAVWAEWCPAWSEGRFEVGPMIFLTRKELGRTFRHGIELGRDWERKDPTPEPEPEALATVHFLRKA